MGNLIYSRVCTFASYLEIQHSMCIGPPVYLLIYRATFAIDLFSWSSQIWSNSNKGNGPNDDLERKALKRKSRFFVCGWIGSATSHDIFYNPNSWKLLDLSIGPITITNNIHLVYWSCLPKYCVFHHLKEYKFSSRPIQHSPQFWSIEIPY